MSSKGITMKSVFAWRAVFTVGLLYSFQAIANPPMQVPMAPQAIELQMQQKRTQEQREAIDAKKNQFMKTTSLDCEAAAIDNNGKALAGAAKTASIKKCMG